MYSSYAVNLYSSYGLPAARLESWQQLQWARTVNAVGSLSLTTKYTPALYAAIHRDSLIEVVRTDWAGHATLAGETYWLVSKYELALGDDGSLTIQIQATDLLDILRRRLVAAESNTSGATKPAADAPDGLPSETIIKQFVTEQICAARYVGGAGVLGLAANIGVDFDGRGGAPEYATCAWQDVLSACQSVAQASAADGQYIAFDLVPISLLTYQFRTFLGQRGSNRLPGSPKPLDISADSGRLTNFRYTVDFGSSASFAVCTGSNSNGLQTSVGMANDSLETLGPFSHIESYGSASSTKSGTTVQSLAQQALRAKRAIVELSGQLQETSDFLFGRDLSFGDAVTFTVSGHTYPAYLEMMSFQVDSGGRETLSVTMRGELVDPATGQVMPI